MRIRLDDGFKFDIKQFKYMSGDVDRHGNVRIYCRRNGVKVRLRDLSSIEPFMAEYREALKGNPQAPEKPGRGPVAKFSVRWVFERYYASLDFLQLNEKETQSRRRATLDDFCEKYGGPPYVDLQAQQIRIILAKKFKFPGAANNLLKSLRVVGEWAVRTYPDEIKTNPARYVKNLKPNNPNGIHKWTPEEVEQYEAHFSVGTKARLALEIILLAGGARNSDAYKLGKQHLTKPTEQDPLGRIKYTQFKGRNKKPIHVDNRVLPELREILDASPCGDLTFIVSEKGTPFASAASFGNRMKKWCKEAGLPHCCAHGLRKASACRGAELGLTHSEIKAFNGWRTLRMVELYTKGADTKKMSDNAAMKLEAGQKSNESVPPSGGGDESGTKKVKKA